MIFLGTFKHNLDEKCRLVLPSKLVSKLSKNIVVSKGFDGCLELRDEKNFEIYSASLMNFTQTKKDSRIVVRQLLANAADLSIDNANRILIPEVLLNEASIKKEVVIIGVGNKIEIWNKDIYEKIKKETDKTFINIADKLGEKDE